MIRRTIPELVAKYKLNSSVRDVFVEGQSDRKLLRWFMAAKGYDAAAVLEIDLIDVPPDMLAKYGLAETNPG